MSLRFLMALAATLAFTAGPAFADDPPKKPDSAETLLSILFNQEVLLDDATNINDIPLFELLQKLSKRYGVTFVINEEASFKAADLADIKERKPNLAATQLRGMTLHEFLHRTLDSMGATYLVRGNAIEIVTPAYAAKVAKAATRQDESGRTTLNEPLVSAVMKEKPLAEAAALLAERYDLNIVLSPQVGDASKVLVTARLLNVPADKAIDIIAVQNDLRVVRKGNAFLITTPQHAKELAAEKLEAEMQRIQLEKLREAPPPKPQPAAKP